MESFITELFILVALLWILGKSASWAVHSSISLSRLAGLPEFVIGLFVVTLISILPETIISLLSAFSGVPSLGLGTLLGSNVADLTLVFGLVALLSPREIKVQSAFIKKDYLFLAFLLLPLVLGFTGHYSRLDGIILIAGSLLFFYSMLREKAAKNYHVNNNVTSFSILLGVLILTGSLLLLSASAHYTVQYAVRIAEGLAVSPALIGLLVVALGTTLPEFLFSLRAVRHAHSTLALGDILGTVIADATFVLGLVALIHPFSFNPRLTIVTGIFMLLAGLFFLSLIRSEKKFTKTEGLFLVAFYIVFIMVEFVLRDWTPLITP